MNELRIGHHGLRDRVCRREIGNDALVYNGGNILPLLGHHVSMLCTGAIMAFLVECRYVGAGHKRKRTKNFDTRGASIS